MLVLEGGREVSMFKWEIYFQDTGCEHFPRCQTCPLPKCNHDMTKTEVTPLRFDSKRARVLDLYRRLRGSDPGLPNMKVIALAAAETGITDRTVYRVLEAARTTNKPG